MRTTTVRCCQLVAVMVACSHQEGGWLSLLCRWKLSFMFIFLDFWKLNFWRKYHIWTNVRAKNYIWTIFGDSYLGWRNAPRLQAQPAVLGSFGQVSFNSTIGHHLSAFVRQRQIQGLRQRQLQILCQLVQIDKFPLIRNKAIDRWDCIQWRKGRGSPNAKKQWGEEGTNCWGVAFWGHFHRRWQRGNKCKYGT